MKWLLFIFACALFSCKKDNQSAGIPDGVWVDKDRPLDTIRVYRENGRNILFDNSASFRASPGPSDAFAKWIYKLEPGKIYIRFYTQTTEEYSTWDFVWITEGQEFSISANAIRPYLSSIGAKLVYEKVR